MRVRPYSGPTPDKLAELLNNAPLPSATPVPARRGRGGGRAAGPRIKRTATAADSAVPESDRRDLAFGKKVIGGKGTPVEILVTTQLLEVCSIQCTHFVRLSTPAFLWRARCTRLSSST